MIIGGLARARNIVCVSEATRADVLRILPSVDRNVTRVYNALNYPYRPMDSANALQHLRRSMNIPADRPLHSACWRQSVVQEPVAAGVLTIFALLHARLPDLRLVMAGKPWTTEMRRIAATRNLERSAIEVTDASEEGPARALQPR